MTIQVASKSEVGKVQETLKIFLKGERKIKNGP